MNKHKHEDSERSIVLEAGSLSTYVSFFSYLLVRHVANLLGPMHQLCAHLSRMLAAKRMLLQLSELPYFLKAFTQIYFQMG